MEQKHTPGPWVFEEPMSDQFWIVQANLAPHDWSPIAIITDDSSEDAMDRGTSRPISKRESKANARLIAAAPELLETLQAVRDNLVRLAWAENSIMVEGIDKVLAKVKAAS